MAVTSVTQVRLTTQNAPASKLGAMGPPRVSRPLAAPCFAAARMPSCRITRSARLPATRTTSQRDPRRIQLLGQLRDGPIADLAEPNSRCLELRRERARIPSLLLLLRGPLATHSRPIGVSTERRRNQGFQT